MPVDPTPPKPTASAHRFARNIRWQFVANGGQILLGGGYLILLGRILGPSGFGTFSAVMAIVTVIGLFLEMRLQEVVARDFCQLDEDVLEATPHHHHIVDLFLLEFLSRLIPAALLFAFSSLFAQFIHVPMDNVDFIWLAAAGFLLAKCGNSVSMGLLRVLGRTDLIAYAIMLDWGLRLLLSVILIFIWHVDVMIALWVALFAGAIGNLLQNYWAIKKYKARVGALEWTKWRLRPAWHRLRGAWRLIFSNLGISSSDLMAKDLDVALISSFLTAEKVGLYKMSKSIVQVIWRAIDPFYLAIMPEIQKLWQRGEASAMVRLMRKTSLRLFLLAVLLIGLAVGTVALIGPHILGRGYDQVPMLMLYMSGWILVCAPLIWGIPLAIAINRPELSVLGSMAGLIVGLMVFIALIPIYGLTGAALAWNASLVSSFAFTALMAVRYAWSHDKLKAS